MIKQHVECTCGKCKACEMELFQCTVCGAAEGELNPNECPGLPLSAMGLELFYRGEVRVIQGAWYRNEQFGWRRMSREEKIPLVKVPIAERIREDEYLERGQCPSCLGTVVLEDGHYICTTPGTCNYTKEVS